jgi:hypothetical protein
MKIKLFEFNGVRKTLCGWALATGLTYECVQSRFHRGKPLDAPKSRAGRPRTKGVTRRYGERLARGKPL